MARKLKRKVLRGWLDPKDAPVKVGGNERQIIFNKKRVWETDKHCKITLEWQT